MIFNDLYREAFEEDMTTEQRLEAFFEAIGPIMTQFNVETAIIAVAANNTRDDDTFTTIVRIGGTGDFDPLTVSAHLGKLHIDVHAALDEAADRIEGVLPPKPSELN